MGRKRRYAAQNKVLALFSPVLCQYGLEISTLREIIASLEQDHAKRIGDYSFLLVSKEKERFGTVYRIEVYHRNELVLKSPVLLRAPLKEYHRHSNISRKNDDVIYKNETS